MSDKLVFDLAQEVEGTPNVFVRKDWINILDNQNTNYANNQSVIDTSQLSNSNKYMSYREAYFSIPFILTVATIGESTAVNAVVPLVAQPFQVATSATSGDSCIGLKNWFGQIIHSFTLDYNGTTIIQQTPYINMWNSFKLMTSLSMADVRTQGATIGFYPDDPTSWMFVPGADLVANGSSAACYGFSPSGMGTCNNSNQVCSQIVEGAFNNFNSGRGNIGFTKRSTYINMDGDANTGVFLTTAANAIRTLGAPYKFLVGGTSVGFQTQMTNLWKSSIFKKVSKVAAGAAGVLQIAIVATVYLKHIHSFFNMCPLLKGVFMKMTMNLNNATTGFCAQIGNATNTVPAASPAVRQALYCTSVSVPVGGINPVLIASGAQSGDLINNGAGGASGMDNGGFCYFPVGNVANPAGNEAAPNAIWYMNYRCNLSVGSTCLDPTLSGINGVDPANLSKSIYLYIPAYTFNPVFEQAYLSSPVKQIKYTDVYQYQVLGVGTSNQFNNLLTNGIANIKSVLILPYYSNIGGAPAGGIVSLQNTSINTNTGFLNGVPVWQSPFDPAGTGPTSPCCWLTNFNIQISGQNAIYNVERYNFEQWNNQLYGQNAVNGGLTDGLTSGLIDRQAFDMEYCYYYVNVERMLPVEQSVPKSVQVLGTNTTTRTLDLYCFIEYGVDISIDALTGARV